MDPAKDYYAILGIAHSADTAIIRAAYKTLAQKRHPDRNIGDESEAQQQMSELSEAYAVLNDPTTRARYDEVRRVQEADDTEAFEAHADGETGADEDAISIDKAWSTAADFYPELIELEARLGKVSRSLASDFKQRVVAAKAYHEAGKLALEAESAFLTSYFGDDEKLVEFARILILSGHKDAAKDLNTAIKVLGEGTRSDTIIDGLRRKYGLSPQSAKTVSTRAQAQGDLQKEQRLIDGVRAGTLAGFQLGSSWYLELDGKGRPIKRTPEGRADAGQAAPPMRYARPLFHVVGIATVSVFLLAVVLALV